MTKTAIAIICFCIVCGIFFGIQAMQNQAENLEAAKAVQLGNVVFSRKAIAKGAQIDASAIEEREVEKWKVPQYAVPAVHLAAGKEAAHDVGEGQILLMSDLVVKPSGHIRIDNTP